jgi:hypothetical protein
MQHIVEALASKKAWALDLVAYWDHILFPNADAPQSTSAGDQRLEDAEDDNDFFDSAPAVESPMQPVFFFVQFWFPSLIVFLRFVPPTLQVVLH